MIRPALTEIGIFLIPFAVYALFLIATRSGLLVQIVLAGASSSQDWCWARWCWCRQFRPARAIFRRAAELDLHSRPYRERQVRARSGKMSGWRGDARRCALAEIRSGRRASSQLLNGNGEEARVVGGAVRNALLGRADRRHRYRDHGAARRGDPPRQGCRHQERADRHRARHRDAGRRRAAVRGHDAARGYRDLRPQGQGRIRPRLGAGRRAARLHHQRPVGRCRGRGARPRRRARRYRGEARALHRRPRPADRRGLSAHPPVLPHSRRLSARASPIAPDISPASAGARGLRACRPNACAWKC